MNLDLYEDYFVLLVVMTWAISEHLFIVLVK